jgi:hypothetical protein
MHDNSENSINAAVSFENSQHDYSQYPLSSTPVEHESMLSLLYENTNNGAAYEPCASSNENCRLCFYKDLEIRDLKFRVRNLEEEISQLRDGSQANLYMCSCNILLF